MLSVGSRAAGCPADLLADLSTRDLELAEQDAPSWYRALGCMSCAVETSNSSLRCAWYEVSMSAAIRFCPSRSARHGTAKTYEVLEVLSI